LLVADRYPDRVAHLVMVEGDVGGGGEQPLDEVTDAISSWPASFPSDGAARAFFGGDNPAGNAWADGYEERDGRWWPLFDPALTREIMRPVFAEERWDAWDRLTCRVDLVVGENSAIDRNRIDLMCTRRPETGLHAVSGAGHDVHLDQPGRWIALLERLL
jgi:pimeloyl-ACP methyl ester carboxylesterase